MAPNAARTAQQSADATGMAHSGATQQHGVCITGLQRSYPEFSHNIHYSLSNLYSGWREGGATIPEPFDLGRAVAFFGVRPANDSWSTVRTDLPPLMGESIQTPCGLARAPWFTAWAKTKTQQVTYGFSFVQMMCDLRACHQLVLAHEKIVGRDFETLARLRLDLAWETPLTMPPIVAPNTVYTSRMNTKSGINDKWALGRRAVMAIYLDRVRLIPLANAMWNRSAPAVGLKTTTGKEGLLYYDCGAGKVNVRFSCAPRRLARSRWQSLPDGKAAAEDPAPATVHDPVTVRPTQRRFSMTSEGFLMWALWRSNVTLGFEPSWMFCKFGNAVNFTARLCVPRMRKQSPCTSLVCAGGLTDCLCKNQTCGTGKTKLWYCESVRGGQLSLNPYRSGGRVVY